LGIKDFNFVFDYVEERLVNQGHVQYWVFHEYPPEFLADMIDYAIDVYLNKKDEYNEYCIKAREHALKWDYRLIYPKLLKHIGIHVRKKPYRKKAKVPG